MIPYGKQEISNQDIESVVEVLNSDFITQGPKVPEFEQALICYTGAKYACAVNSGTSALHIACLALDVGKGDIVWTTPNTFVASANCALYCGAQIDFVDIDPRTYNLSAVFLSEKLVKARQENRLPKVVIPVHFSGQPCEMKAIHQLSLEYGFSIIEDASHAVGASYLGKPVGNCDYSDITVFSFHPVKIITTGEGGMALTNSSDLAYKMRLYRSHGIDRDIQEENNNEGKWFYQQTALGFNYRMTDLQAALGVSQSKRISEFVFERHRLAARYDALLADLPLDRPYQSSASYSARHLYVIQLFLDSLKKTRKEIFNELVACGIGVNVHYIPVHTQPLYRALGFNSGDFPEAERYYSRAISLPLFHHMTESQQDSIVDALTRVLA